MPVLSGPTTEIPQVEFAAAFVVVVAESAVTCDASGGAGSSQAACSLDLSSQGHTCTAIRSHLGSTVGFCSKRVSQEPPQRRHLTTSVRVRARARAPRAPRRRRGRGRALRRIARDGARIDTTAGMAPYSVPIPRNGCCERVPRVQGVE